MQPERNAIMTVTQGSTALQQPKRAESTCTVGTRDRYYTFSRPRLRARRPPFSDPGILQAFYKVHLCAETTETNGLNSLLTVLLQTGGRGEKRTSGLKLASFANAAGPRSMHT